MCHQFSMYVISFDKFNVCDFFFVQLSTKLFRKKKKSIKLAFFSGSRKSHSYYEIRTGGWDVNDDIKSNLHRNEYILL